MTDESHRTAAMRAGERAFKQTLREHQVDTREREAAEADAAQDEKIARLRAARLAKELAERKA
jgi:hypothetical protein